MGLAGRETWKREGCHVTFLSPLQKLEERFRFNRRDLIGFEFTVLVALELALYLPENQVLPHYRRLTQQF